MRRAVITGIGPVTPIGIGKEAFWTGLCAGESAVDRITAFDPSPFRTQVAAEVRNFHADDFIDAKRLKRLDRYSQFAIAAAQLAMQDAKLDPLREARDRIGVCLGSALGGMGFAEAQLNVFRDRGIRAVEPSLALSVFCGAGSCNIAIEVGATGPASANANSCASGTIALGEALSLIRDDRVDIVFAGGAEAPLAPLCFGAFAVIRAMSCRNDDPRHACRPFDAARDGFVMGEGAAILVVEELRHAQDRGAHIYGEISGYSLTNDAHHMVAPRPDGAEAARAITLALTAASMRPDDIDYINAHGSSTPLNDRTETLAIKHVFGAHAYRLLVSGTKGHHAHPLGAAGAIEAAACALALEHQFVPPTVNLETPDPECDLNYQPRVGRPCTINALLSNSFGFGGINACMIMRRVTGEE
ncbi:MAG: beta-ketoacyl-ACP synthase II [Armatimonadota bacterium]